jgi:hypothetical protein
MAAARLGSESVSAPRPTLVLVLCAAPIAVLAGCPPRELRIDVSASGMRAIVSACTVEEFCPGGAQNCCVAPTEGTCCTSISVPELADFADDLAIQLVLSDRRQGIPAAAARSECIALGVDCISQPDIDSASRCYADAVNRGLNDQLGSLAFDGMDPDHVDVFLMIYAGAGQCRSDRLAACAVLAVLPGSETYDALCGGCTGQAPRGGDGAFNIEGSPCDWTCLVQGCQALLAQSGV